MGPFAVMQADPADARDEYCVEVKMDEAGAVALAKTLPNAWVEDTDTWVAEEEEEMAEAVSNGEVI